MKTTLERLDATKVKLLVEVEPDRVSKAFDAAARQLASQVTIKGFRKGRVPRRVLESRLGKEAIAQQAVEPAVSRFYAEAIQAQEIEPVAPPEIDLQRFTEEEGCAFQATVEVRPDIDLPDREQIDVTFPEWEVSEEEVRSALQDLRERFAELEEVERPAHIGDYVTLDVQVARAGQLIEGATAEDALYEVGSGGVTPELDQQLAGAVAGQTLVYTDTLPEDYPEHGGEWAEFTVVVKDVRAKHFPDLDDDFAATASEFDTLAELEEDIRRSLARRKLMAAQQELRGRVLEAYLALVEIPLPEALVESEKHGRLAQLRRQADRYGVEIDEFLRLQGTDLQTVTDDLDQQARQAVEAQLVLEALARKVGIRAESAEFEREIRLHAIERGVDPATIARTIQQQGTVGVLVGDVVRRKALDLLVESAHVEGAPSPDELGELGLSEAAEQTAAQATELLPTGLEPSPDAALGSGPSAGAVEGESDTAGESPSAAPTPAKAKPAGGEEEAAG